MEEIKIITGEYWKHNFDADLKTEKFKGLFIQGFDINSPNKFLGLMRDETTYASSYIYGNYVKPLYMRGVYVTSLLDFEKVYIKEKISVCYEFKFNRKKRLWEGTGFVKGSHWGWNATCKVGDIMKGNFGLAKILPNEKRIQKFLEGRPSLIDKIMGAL
ncbi:MAG: hypothetical protein PHD81_02495 [Candidatus Nanoarchaeia archaeon]|nr:hypothetical protein [Candidatus Nanoarchaeia archaeon]MDD5587955.1 hypothetical protein [Candidatus Nanoarchaeia archaeon]